MLLEDRRFIELGKIGLVVNPAAGKDIRRLIAYGSVFGNQEKINYTLRLLRGIESVANSPVEVVYMPDPYDLIEIVEKNFSSPEIIFRCAPIPVFGDETDTLNFTDWAVNEEQVVALVGDRGEMGLTSCGQNKCPHSPVLPFGGTNNVFAENIEPTVMGWR
jgi:predicted polyphosphate/ATP-dependent NAD kinase